MNTLDFNSLSVAKQIEYINNELAKNLTLREIIERDLKLTRSTIRRRFSKYGYVLDKEKNKYINSYIYTESNKNITNSNTTYVKGSSTNITNSNKNITDGNINITKSNITFTIEEIIALKELVAQNKNKEKIINPCFSGDLKVKTVKIYTSVLEDYNRFVKNNKQLKQQDIISMALKEFLDKYN